MVKSVVSKLIRAETIFRIKVLFIKWEFEAFCEDGLFAVGLRTKRFTALGQM